MTTIHHLTPRRVARMQRLWRQAGIPEWHVLLAAVLVELAET